MKKAISLLCCLCLLLSLALAEDTPCALRRPLPEGFQVQIQRDTPVDDAWFSDALMIGDSITDSLSMYDIIPTLQIEALIGQSAQGAVNNRTQTVNGQRMTMADMVVALHPAKVLVMLGSNGLDKSRTPYVMPSYHQLLDHILGGLPEAEIYLLAVTPVMDYAQEKHPRLYNQNIWDFNTAVRTLAEEHAVHFVDINTPLLNSAGNEADRAVVSGDGMHLTRAGAERVAEAIRSQVGED